MYPTPPDSEAGSLSGDSLSSASVDEPQRRYWLDPITRAWFYVESDPRPGDPAPPADYVPPEGGQAAIDNAAQPQDDEGEQPQNGDQNEEIWSIWHREEVNRVMATVANLSVPLRAEPPSETPPVVAGAAQEQPLIEQFMRPESTVVLFNQNFPLPPRLFRKWKDGVRFWPPNKVVKSKDRRAPTKTTLLTFQALHSAGIIEPAKPKQYVASCFTVEKATKAARPITNFSRLSKLFDSPKFSLKSISQLIDFIEMKSTSTVYYCKLDIKQAFFNIPVHPASRYVTIFQLGDKYFQYTVLPMGMGISPFVMQTFCKAICNVAKASIIFSFGHLDDILLIDHDKQRLQETIDDVLLRLFKSKWPVNYAKSILRPATSVTFLGSVWNQMGVTRLDSVTKLLVEIVDFCTCHDLSVESKLKQRLRGFLGYYLQFAGKVHSVINSWLSLPSSDDKRSLRSHVDLIVSKKSLLYHHTNNSKVTLYTDATPNQLGILVKQPNTGDHERSIPLGEDFPIHWTETSALIEGLSFLQELKYPRDTQVNCYVDNFNTFYAFKKGSMNWPSVPLAIRFQLIEDIANYRSFYRVIINYIRSAANPADVVSRQICHAPTVLMKNASNDSNDTRFVSFA